MNVECIYGPPSNLWMYNWISFTENHNPVHPIAYLCAQTLSLFHSNGHLPSTGIGMAGGGSGVGHHVHHPGHHPGSTGYGHHLSNAGSGSVLVGNAGRYGQVPSPAPNGRVPSPAPGDGCNPYQGGNHNNNKAR